MSYIGRGVDAISNVEKLDNITFSGTTTYALTKSSAAFTPVGANNILLSMDGVIQSGNFTVSGTNIVFTGFSPTSSNTCNFILHYGTGVLNVPADGSIVAAKMAANSVDSDSYVDGSIDAVHLSANSVDSDAYVDGSIDNAHLADDAVGVAELSATGTASSSTFLRGDNAWAAAGGTNTPIFSAEATGNTSISNSTFTRVPFNVETIDTGSKFNISTGTFTPGDTSKYLLGASVTIQDIGDGKKLQMSLYEDGSTKYSSGQADFMNTAGVNDNLTITGTWLLTSASDSAYYEIFIFHNKGSAQQIRGDFLNNFWGIKILE